MSTLLQNVVTSQSFTHLPTALDIGDRPLTPFTRLLPHWAAFFVDSPSPPGTSEVRVPMTVSFPPPSTVYALMTSLSWPSSKLYRQSDRPLELRLLDSTGYLTFPFGYLTDGLNFTCPKNKLLTSLQTSLVPELSLVQQMETPALRCNGRNFELTFDSSVSFMTRI